MRIAIIHSQQPTNRCNFGDTERDHMRPIALRAAELVREHGHEVIVGPIYDTTRDGKVDFYDNVAWLNAQHKAKPVQFAVSFHSNAVGGSLVAWYPGNAAGEKLARAIKARLDPVVPDSCGTRDNLLVHEIAKTNPTVVLTESYRHDTDAGAKFIHANGEAIARAHADGILDIIGRKAPYVHPPVPPVVVPVPEPEPVPTPPVAVARGLARVASVNLAQREDAADAAAAWLGGTLRASAYLLQECTYGMAVAIAKGLGWTDSAGRPCWRVDENRNAVVWDPKKWRDLRSKAVSLTEAADDLGDRHYRSVQWVELEHRAAGQLVWLGSSHLSNGDSDESAAARVAQARVLGGSLPTGAPLLLGIDRNGRGTSEPTRVLAAAGLVDLTAGADPRRTHPAGDTRTDGVQIDAIFGRGVALRSLRLVDPGSVTDHRAWVATLAIPADTL